MKKLLLGLVLSTGIVMANETIKDDLLSLATSGKSTGSQLEMNKNDMLKANGGWYIRGYWSSRINRVSSFLNRSSYSNSYSRSRTSSRVSFADMLFQSRLNSVRNLYTYR